MKTPTILIWSWSRSDSRPDDALINPNIVHTHRECRDVEVNVITLISKSRFQVCIFFNGFYLLFSVFALNSHDNGCSAYSLQKGEPKTYEKKAPFTKTKTPKRTYEVRELPKKLFIPLGRNRKNNNTHTCHNRSCNQFLAKWLLYISYLPR